MYSLYQEEPQTELSVSCPMPAFSAAWVFLSMDWDLAFPIKTAQFVYLIYIK